MVDHTFHLCIKNLKVRLIFKQKLTNILVKENFDLIIDQKLLTNNENVGTSL